MFADLPSVMPFAVRGRVVDVTGLSITAAGLPVPLGAICRVGTDVRFVYAEVVGFHENRTVLYPYGPLSGVRSGDAVTLRQSVPSVRVGEDLLGRVVDGLGQPLDDQSRPVLRERRSTIAPPVSALSRPPIDERLPTGVRTLDGLLTLGRGQRIGVFAGSGVGKSTLLGQIARGGLADVNVIVLVGERGREVREFIENDLGPEGLARSVVVVATGDEPALMRLRAAELGTSIAEYFRDSRGGRDVLLMMDSVTRYALAQREIALAAGEPPATRGYPPSVFSRLPRLLERSGRTEHGSITGIYTVLVEGDDTSEPVSDAVRGILDGHVVLSRSLAERGHWPAIDFLQSVSRVMPAVVDSSQQAAALRFRKLWAAYRDSEDLIAIGAYQPGSDETVDESVRRRPAMRSFLQQPPDEHTPADDTRRLLAACLS